MKISKDGWMDGWVGGWVGGWAGGWVGGRMDDMMFGANAFGALVL